MAGVVFELFCCCFFFSHILITANASCLSQIRRVLFQCVFFSIKLQPWSTLNRSLTYSRLPGDSALNDASKMLQRAKWKQHLAKSRTHHWTVAFGHLKYLASFWPWTDSSLDVTVSQSVPIWVVSTHNFPFSCTWLLIVLSFWNDSCATREMVVC